MPSTLAALFRPLPGVSRLKVWHDKQMGQNTFGAPPTAAKLWRQLRQDFRYLVGIWVRQLHVLIGMAGVRVRVRKLPPVKPTKKFIIALVDMPLSMQATRRCIESASQHGEGRHLEIMPAVDKFHSEAFFKEHSLTWNAKFSAVTDAFAGMGCFASHYKLWRHCVDVGEPIVVLEHDAMFVRPIPAMRFKDVIVLSLGFWSKPPLQTKSESMPSLKRPESLHRGDCLFGTHAYVITPEGAQKLITQASQRLLPPVDCFMSKQHIDIISCCPYPVELVAEFSSIATWNKQELA